MLGTDLESVDKNEIIVEIFPNRPDMLSEQGFARAFASFIGEKTGLREYKVNKSEYEVIIEPSVKDIRPYTVCAVIKNLKFDDEKIREIIQIQEKLHTTLLRNRKKGAIGIYPLEHIKFPITYFAEDPKKIKFLPLESKKKMTGLQILSQHPTGREYAHLLEGKNKFPFFKDGNSEILSMPPVINSEKTGKVSENTKDVFIECSGFDLNTLNVCLNIIVTSMSEMGGIIYETKVNYEKPIITPNLKAKEWDIDINYINKRLGLTLKESELKTLLEKMGFGYKNKKALVPAYRADIMHQVDFVEDIAIAYGYENFTEEIPKVSTIGIESPLAIKKRKLAELLAGLGLLECETYNLTNQETQNEKTLNDIKLIELENSFSKTYNVLRAWLIPNLLQVLEENKHYEYPQNLFTIGKTFKDKEQEKLAITLCDSNMNFTNIKQILDYLMRMLNLEYQIEPCTYSTFIEGRTGKIIVNKQCIGFLGEIHPQVLQNFSLEFPVASLELNLTKLFTKE
jgi:phenylalanyl-tRNA synthetase beta chain